MLFEAFKAKFVPAPTAAPKSNEAPPVNGAAATAAAVITPVITPVAVSVIVAWVSI